MTCARGKARQQLQKSIAVLQKYCETYEDNQMKARASLLKWYAAKSFTLEQAVASFLQGGFVSDPGRGCEMTSAFANLEYCIQNAKAAGDRRLEGKDSLFSTALTELSDSFCRSGTPCCACLATSKSITQLLQCLCNFCANSGTSLFSIHCLRLIRFHIVLFYCFAYLHACCDCTCLAAAQISSCFALSAQPLVGVFHTGAEAIRRGERALQLVRILRQASGYSSSCLQASSMLRATFKAPAT